MVFRSNQPINRIFASIAHDGHIFRSVCYKVEIVQFCVAVFPNAEVSVDFAPVYCRGVKAHFDTAASGYYDILPIFVIEYFAVVYRRQIGKRRGRYFELRVFFSACVRESFGVILAHRSLEIAINRMFADLVRRCVHIVRRKRIRRERKYSFVIASDRIGNNDGRAIVISGNGKFHVVFHFESICRRIIDRRRIFHFHSKRQLRNGEAAVSAVDKVVIPACKSSSVEHDFVCVCRFALNVIRRIRETAAEIRKSSVAEIGFVAVFKARERICRI